MSVDRAHGVRINAVQQGTVPPYAYTLDPVGRGRHGLICAGAVRYSVQQVSVVLRTCAEELAGSTGRVPRSLSVRGLGEFTLGSVHPEWLEVIVPSEHRDHSHVAWLQVVPSPPNRTIDVPDLSRPRSSDGDPAWRWLDSPWDIDAPSDSHLVTTLGVLTGRAPLTIFRWESGQWEALDRPAADVDRSEARVVPLGLLTAIVDDWSPFVTLRVGEGLEHVAGQWQPA
jgi:hypothetical protein